MWPDMLRTSHSDGGIVGCLSQTEVCRLTTAVYVEQSPSVIANQAGGAAWAAIAAGGGGGAAGGGGGAGGGGAGGGGGGAGVGTTPPPEHTTLTRALGTTLLSRQQINHNLSRLNTDLSVTVCSTLGLNSTTAEVCQPEEPGLGERDSA